MSSLISISDGSAPKDISDGVYLKPAFFVLNDGSVFFDKQLPANVQFQPNPKFNKKYFTTLHETVALSLSYNFSGARIKISHSCIRVDRIRELLPLDFDDIAVIQYLEYGFPLGLAENAILKPSFKNHSSSYQYYTYIDKFICTELDKGGICGPFSNSPFDDFMLSPLMTSPQQR